MSVNKDYNILKFFKKIMKYQINKKFILFIFMNHGLKNSGKIVKNWKDCKKKSIFSNIEIAKNNELL